MKQPRSGRQKLIHFVVSRSAFGRAPSSYFGTRSPRTNGRALSYNARNPKTRVFLSASQFEVLLNSSPPSNTNLHSHKSMDTLVQVDCWVFTARYAARDETRPCLPPSPDRLAAPRL